MRARRRAFSRPFLTPVFATSVVILILGATGLRPLLGALEQRYAKQSIALRKPLRELDLSALSSFRTTPEWFRTLDGDALGTHDYIWLDGVDSALGADDLQLSLFVAYYSDPRDKVPHTPEVCYRQVGATIRTLTTIALDVPALGPDRTPLEIRFVDLESRGANRIVLYVFCASGEFCYDRQQVRWIVARPGDRHLYFSKIEVVATYQGAGDKERAVGACKRLLGEALPVLVQEHFPDTADLRG
jgi:hypothetical protein